MSKIVVASGGFDPLHIGHIEYLEKAKQLGDKLIVILNSDEFLMKKKGFVFMKAEERKIIIKNLRMVDLVVNCIDQDMTVCKTLSVIDPDIFAKGGDRTKDEIPERYICGLLGIEIVDGLGPKIRSSSELVDKMENRQLKIGKKESKNE